MALTKEKRWEHITKHPERHLHDFEKLIECCMVDGVIDTKLMQAHSDYVDFGSNGGRKCDVLSGPCACGAWH